MIKRFWIFSICFHFESGMLLAHNWHPYNITGQTRSPKSTLIVFQSHNPTSPHLFLSAYFLSAILPIKLVVEIDPEVLVFIYFFKNVSFEEEHMMALLPFIRESLFWSCWYWLASPLLYKNAQEHIGASAIHGLIKQPVQDHRHIEKALSQTPPIEHYPHLANLATLPVFQYINQKG